MTLPPVALEQAERNAAVLDAEVRAYEIGHGQHMHGMKRATTRPGQPRQPGPSTSTLPPITPQQAAANRALLKAELREHAKRHRATRDLEPCGSTAGYRRHERDHEPPCQRCCDAHADAEWERSRRRRGIRPPRDGGRPEDYAELCSWNVPREEAARRMNVKIQTTYDYDERLRQQEGAAA
jgi:hypothetical protein